MSTPLPHLHLRLPGTGEANTAFGLPREFYITAEDSGGALSMWIENVPPGAGPPLHLHRREHEVFHVLAGRVLFACGEDRSEVAPGGIVMIPPGVPHAFFNTGTEPCRLMVTITPGGLEGLFREVQAAALAPPGDMAAIEAVAAHYHLEFVGPPLTP
jgi:mannose-6-phosphate isomerase-like protein (cupin superfamily)